MAASTVFKGESAVSFGFNNDDEFVVLIGFTQAAANADPILHPINTVHSKAEYRGKDFSISATALKNMRLFEALPGAKQAPYVSVSAAFMVKQK